MASDGAMWDYTEWQGREPKPYGDEVTYRIGLGWLDRACMDIEDWGAGLGYGRQFVTTADYTAIDSSPTSKPWVDVIENLEDRASSPDGIFMRHVLEHNANWEQVLENAVESFQKRMVLVMFTPFLHVTGPTPGRDRLDICFRREDLTDWFAPYLIAELDVVTNTQYGREHLFFLSREDDELLAEAMGQAQAYGAQIVVPV